MKNRVGMASIVGLTLVLTACGGGSGGDNYNGGSSGNSPTNQNFYTFDYDYEDSINSYDIESKKFIINNGMISQEEDALESYALTSNTLYKPGYKFNGQSQANSLTNWTVYELPGIGAKITFEAVNISGKNVYDTIFTGYKEYLNYLFDESIDSGNYQLFAKAYNLGRIKPNEKFGSATQCLRLQKIAPLPNSFYLSFDTSAASKIDKTYEQQLANINDLKKLETQDNKVDITSGTWAGYRWMRVKTDYKDASTFNMDFGFVEFNGQLYRTEVENAESIDISSYLAQAKQVLKESTDDSDRANLKLIIAEFENGCAFYNETAATQIANYIR